MLAVFEPDELPFLEGLEPEEAMEAGILREDQEALPLAPRWDKRPKAEEIDLGDIGEDRDGVWVTIHPATLLAESPNLWAPYARWRHGVRDLTLTEFQRLTAFDARCHVTMLAANGRAMNRPREGEEQ